MWIRNLAIAGSMAIGLAACASGPERVNSTSESVSYTFEGDGLKDVSHRATDYCAQKGGVATLKSVGKTEDKSVAIFTCA